MKISLGRFSITLTKKQILGFTIFWSFFSWCILKPSLVFIAYNYKKYLFGYLAFSKKGGEI